MEKEKHINSKSYEKFNLRLNNVKKVVNTFLNTKKNIIGYGASTKGNIILNHCGIDKAKLKFMYY